MLPSILATRHLVYCMTARGRRGKRSHGTSVDNGHGSSDMSDTFLLSVCIGRRLKSLQETKEPCQKWSCSQTQAYSWNCRQLSEWQQKHVVSKQKMNNTALFHCQFGLVPCVFLTPVMNALTVNLYC